MIYLNQSIPNHNNQIPPNVSTIDINGSISKNFFIINGVEVKYRSTLSERNIKAKEITCVCIMVINSCLDFLNFMGSDISKETSQSITVSSIGSLAKEFPL